MVDVDAVAVLRTRRPVTVAGFRDTTESGELGGATPRAQRLRHGGEEVF